MAICPKSLDLLEIFGAEVIGTAFLLFFGCIGLLGGLEKDQKLDPVQPALVWAFTVTACVLVCMHFFNFIKQFFNLKTFFVNFLNLFLNEKLKNYFILRFSHPSVELT